MSDKPITFIDADYLGAVDLGPKVRASSGCRLGRFVEGRKDEDPAVGARQRVASGALRLRMSRGHPVVFAADTPSLRQTMLQAFRGDPLPPMTEVEAMARRYLGLDSPEG